MAPLSGGSKVNGDSVAQRIQWLHTPRIIIPCLLGRSTIRNHPQDADCRNQFDQVSRLPDSNVRKIVARKIVARKIVTRKIVTIAPYSILSFVPRNQTAMFFSEFSPLVQIFVAQPIAFAGGFVSGLLQLNLADEPVKSWLSHNMTVSGPSTPNPPQNGNSNGPQNITID
jgi:hypothetical protein